MTQPSTGAEDPRTAEDLPANGAGEAGGEAACALHRVCETCGALEDGEPAPVCGRCGTARAG